VRDSDHRRRQRTMLTHWGLSDARAKTTSAKSRSAREIRVRRGYLFCGEPTRSPLADNGAGQTATAFESHSPSQTILIKAHRERILAAGRGPVDLLSAISKKPAA